MKLRLYIKMCRDLKQPVTLEGLKNYIRYTKLAKRMMMNER